MPKTNNSFEALEELKTLTENLKEQIESNDSKSQQEQERLKLLYTMGKVITVIAEKQSEDKELLDESMSNITGLYWAIEAKR